MFHFERDLGILSGSDRSIGARPAPPLPMG